MSAETYSKSSLQIQNIPFEMQAYRQWVVWKLLIRDGKITKEPYQPEQPRFLVSVTNPQTWGTFESAVRTYQSDPEVTGIGFVFSEHDPFFGIDIDDTDKVKTDKGVAERAEIIGLLKSTNTYTERSPSGKGLHLIAFGKPGDDRKGMKFPDAQIEVYSSARYFTVTGDVQPGYGHVTPQQELLDALLARRSVLTVDRSIGKTTAFLRRLDMKDEEVINYLLVRQPDFGPRFYNQDGFVNDWSGAYLSLVGDLDSVTGDPEQILRILLSAPIVTQADPKSGESRRSKAMRRFEPNLVTVRSRREEEHHRWFPHMVDHGREVYERMEASRKQKIADLTAKALANMGDKWSKEALSVFERYAKLAPTPALTVPPGLTGRFVEATLLAQESPFLKYAIPATLASLSGIMGRQYKLMRPKGPGLNLNYLLFVPPGGGKSDTTSVWSTFVWEACQFNNVQEESVKARNFSASSHQGLFKPLEKLLSGVWFNDECAGILSILTNNSGRMTDKYNDLKDGINRLYDASKIGGTPFSPNSSVNATKMELKSIHNLNVSTFWTTQPAKFTLTSADVSDGFLSRCIVIYHIDESGEAQQHPQTQLDGGLFDALCSIVGRAITYDRGFDPMHNPFSEVMVIDTSQIGELHFEMRLLGNKINNETLPRIARLPVHYQAITRLSFNALKIAGLLAAVDNPNAPSITLEQYHWAFSYVLTNFLETMSLMDQGQVGATMSDDVQVVIRVMKQLLLRGKATEIRASDLGNHLRRVKPFKDERSPGDTINRTINEMISSGQLHKGTESRGGRPGVWYSITDDPCWS